MINWFDMPTQGLSNGGQFEIKELTATENKVYQKDGEVYNKVTVNVEGGGGSSDFSTAEVTVTLAEDSATYYWSLPVISDNPKKIIVNNYEQTVGEPVTNKVPLYGGVLEIYFDSSKDTITDVTGNATFEDNLLTITGNCAFTRDGGI